ncbi:hypothetical protein C900_03361 [Fulvivirga imtechensis AK7]|uniref:Urease accessory protein UreH-like transmembrane domain-containing protein n=1 Tax=Fulvivirga imtechensis AK7 TaxID=1237149 RepID=L8JRG2_9BACT|nr:sulfite exporter TauE/SafE family protein [Fulvivirga imtechensis]ELR70753.1 hypothetical protein C900_03361 [Fulvivirga imtechensis AK7]
MNGLFISGVLTGLLGSLHCATMCGPLAMTVYSKSTLARQLIYNGGRLSTYVMLGLLFGSLGQGLAIFGMQRVLSVAMGVFVILLALFPRYQHKLLQSAWHQKIITPLRNLLRGLAAGKNSFSIFLIGFLNGLLPCGLVYMALSLATASGSINSAALVMLGFGLGTTPMMMAFARLSGLLKFKRPFAYQYIIPSVAILMGALLIVRGMALDIPYLSPAMAAVGFDWGMTTCNP